MEDTKQFLKKVSNSPSILVLESDYGFELTLGSSFDISTSAPVNTGFGVGLVETGTKTKSTFIKCKINEEFNPIGGKLEPTIFDKFNSHKKRNKPAAPKLGTFNDEYIYGFYDKSNKIYSLYKL